MTNAFKCFIENGKILMEGTIKDCYDGYLRSLPEGHYEISVNKPKKDRSNQQNRYLFGIVYQAVSDKTGYTLEEVHEIFKTMFLKKYVEISGKTVRITQSTTTLTTTEFEKYAESIRMFAAENLGLNIPEPNEGTA